MSQLIGLKSVGVTSDGSRISPRGGREPSKGGAWTRNFAKFSQKLHEIERIWTQRGGRASLTPPLRSATGNYPQKLVMFYNREISCTPKHRHGIPDGDGSTGSELSESHLHEEERQSGQNQHQHVRDQERRCNETNTNRLYSEMPLCVLCGVPIVTLFSSLPELMFYYWISYEWWRECRLSSRFVK